MERAATLSDCKNYRYDLTRRWGPGPTALWVLVNPSVADGRVDDRTIGRVVEFSSRLGMGSAVVVNLFALISTKPRLLRTHPDPMGGERNDETIRRHMADAELVIAAWGVNGAIRGRGAEVRRLLRAPQCLGRTAAGHPRHPLYVRGDQALEAF